MIGHRLVTLKFIVIPYLLTCRSFPHVYIYNFSFTLASDIRLMKSPSLHLLHPPYTSTSLSNLFFYLSLDRLFSVGVDCTDIHMGFVFLHLTHFMFVPTAHVDFFFLSAALKASFATRCYSHLAVVRWSPGDLFSIDPFIVGALTFVVWRCPRHVWGSEGSILSDAPSAMAGPGPDVSIPRWTGSCSPSN